jgi:Kef-type K+ transport system membrane component KefB
MRGIKNVNMYIVTSNPEKKKKMVENILIQLAIIVGIGLLLSAIVTFLKQPLIIGYIIAGIILGPSLLNIVTANGPIAAFAELGIVVLLFTVGLNLSPKVFRKSGKASLITGIGQIVITALLGFAVSISLNYSMLSSAYIAIALTFSSTIIVIKVLSDTGDSETLAGRISVGILLIQDVAVMIILAILSSVSSGASGESIGLLDLAIIAGALAILIPISMFVLPKVLKKISKSQEYLLLFSLGWCLLLAMIFYKLKLSMEIGALIAGISLSISPYRHEMISKLKPLRDFFIFLFFISLGSGMAISDLGNNIVPIIAFSAFILIAKPIIVFLIMISLGYTKKTALISGMSLAQISEFSLILISLGAKLGNVPSDVSALITMSGLISIAGSTYLMTHAEQIYKFLSKIMPIFFSKENVRQSKDIERDNSEVVIFGYDKIGFSMLKSFKKMGKKFLIVDYNPEVIRYLQSQKINCMFGDAENTSLLDELCLPKRKMIVSTVPIYEINSLILKMVREYNNETIVIPVSNSIEDSLKLYDEGADYVIIPRFLGGEHASKLIEKNEYNHEKFTKERNNHIERLGDRKLIKHFL